MIDMDCATQKGIWVSITPLANPQSVAEHTMALLLACTKNIVQTANAVKGNDWLYRNRQMGCDLAEKTLGLIGLGKIGRFVAGMAKGFGMQVTAYDKYLPPGESSSDIAMLPDMETLLTQADVISLHCPATPETENMINAEAFAAMKQGAILINTARGTLIDEQALYRALTSGQLRAAGLDVSQMEPPQPGNPLLELDNLTLTPHTAAVTEEAMYRMGMHAAWCIHDVLQGKPPRWPANTPQQHYTPQQH